MPHKTMPPSMMQPQSLCTDNHDDVHADASDADNSKDDDTTACIC